MLGSDQRRSSWVDGVVVELHCLAEAVDTWNECRSKGGGFDSGALAAAGAQARKAP